MHSRPPFARHRNRDRGHFEIHICTGQCVTPPPVSTARLLAAAIAISIIVPAFVIVLLAAATYLFGN